MKTLKVDPKAYIAHEIARHTAKKEVTRKKDRRRHIRIVNYFEWVLGVESILCIGARDEREVLDFVDAGYKCTGIDLFSSSRHILKMDMHEMSFRPNEFDLIYASHVLEHSYNPKKLLGDIRRIARAAILVILPNSGELKYRHPTVFDIMANPEEKIGSDFEAFGEYSVWHYGYNDKEIEIFFVFK